MNNHQSKYSFICRAFALGILVYSLSGCIARDEWDTPLMNQLHQPTRQILQDLSFKLYPNSDLISDSFNIHPVKSLSSNEIRKPSYSITSNIWLSTNDDLEMVRKFYSKSLPNTISQQSADGHITFIQLASVQDISSALTHNVSPIIMVEIHHKKLSAEEKTIYQNELNGLKNQSINAPLSRKRINQLERVLADKPLMRISIRKISSDMQTQDSL